MTYQWVTISEVLAKMERVLKYFWVAKLVFLLAAAWLVAGSVNGVIAYKMRHIPDMSTKETRYRPLERNRLQRKDSRIIIERNYFQSALSLSNESSAENVSKQNLVLAKDKDEGEKTTLQATLVGTVVAEPATKWSMAIITDNNASETGIYRVHDNLMEQATILAILTDKVIIDRNNAQEYLMLEEEETPRVRPSQRKVMGRNVSSKLSKGIKKTGPNNYSIERSVLTDALTNMSTLARQARIVPYVRNGKSEGFKIFAIRPNSLFKAAGLQNRDIISKINGITIDSPDKALEIYQKFKTGRSIDIDYIRQGKTQVLHYDIQ